MEWRQTKPTINIERAASEDAVILRPYRQSGGATLRAAADDVLVARYMFAGFPHPYTAEDAAAWVSRASAEDPVENFVIEVGGMFAGAVGLSPRGKGYEGVGVVGYWLTPEYWGSGIATAAVDAIVNYAVENGFRRLVASVYAPNVGSARVLEKNGFVLEGRLREHRVGRDGVIMDELLFGRILRERILDDASHGRVMHMKIQHVRVARSTNRLENVTAFYRDVLGLDVLSRFDAHDGFDGVMLGQSGDSVHFEFTRERGAIGEREPSPEDLVVLYFDEADWTEAERRIVTAGATIVASHNPYWDQHGITIEDPDGYRVVLHRGPWRSNLQLRK